MRHARASEDEIRLWDTLTRNEIRVFMFLKLCANAKNGRCNPKRRTIAEGTGLLPPHVSVAVGGLENKGWIAEDEAGNFQFLAVKKITESVTVTESVITESVTPSAESVSKITESVIPRNIDLKQTKEQRIEQSIPSGGPAGKKDVQKVFDYWRLKLDHPTAKLSPARERLIKARLKDFSVAELFSAIEGCAASGWHNGDNPGGKYWNDIGKNICKSIEQVEMFINQSAVVPFPKRGGETFSAPYPNAETGDINDRLFVPSATMRPAPDLPASIAGVWTKTKAALAKEFSPEVMRNWFEGIVFDGLDKTDRRLLLRAGQANVDWVRIYYSDTLDDCLAAGGLDGYKIAWEVDNGECEPAQLRAAL